MTHFSMEMSSLLSLAISLNSSEITSGLLDPCLQSEIEMLGRSFLSRKMVSQKPRIREIKQLEENMMEFMTKFMEFSKLLNKTFSLYSIS